MFQINLESDFFNILPARPGQGQGFWMIFQHVGSEVVNCLVVVTLHCSAYGHHARVRSFPEGSILDIFCTAEVPSRGLI